MRVFVKVVDKGSSSAAAKALSLSPAMVGNHLQALEQHLGASLLHRTTRRQNLTEFGQQYYDKCLEILAMIADSEAMASGNIEEPKGSITLTAPISFGSEALMPLLGQLYQRYPQLSLNVLLNDRNVDLLEDDIDLAIRIGKLPDSTLISRKLCDYPMVVCASPDYLAQKGKPKRPEDLQSHNCLQFGTHQKTSWKFNIDGQTKTIDVKGHLHINNGRALRQAACHGLGIIMQPTWLVNEDLQQGRLTPLLEDYQIRAREVHLVYLKDRYLPLKVRCLIDFLVDCFAKKTQP